VLGPKLEPFTPTAYADIEFLEELGDPANNADSHVWKVRINGQEPCYALKMVSLKQYSLVPGVHVRTMNAEVAFITCSSRASLVIPNVPVNIDLVANTRLTSFASYHPNT
jgi:hypothetical protein